MATALRELTLSATSARSLVASSKNPASLERFPKLPPATTWLPVISLLNDRSTRKEAFPLGHSPVAGSKISENTTYSGHSSGGSTDATTIITRPSERLKVGLNAVG